MVNYSKMDIKPEKHWQFCNHKLKQFNVNYIVGEEIKPYGQLWKYFKQR